MSCNDYYKPTFQAEGKYQYRYLFVELDDNPYRTIVLEDNR